MIKECPCGEIPTELIIEKGGRKYSFAYGDCCSDWLIEFRSNYFKPDSIECKQLALKAWNGTKRKDKL